MKGKGCDGKGLYPSELDNDDPEYLHKGVDISAEKGDMVGEFWRQVEKVIRDNVYDSFSQLK